MAIIRRPNTNYKGGTGTKIAKADNSGLDAVDITISHLGTLYAVWAGPLPTVTGAGLEFTVPTYRGSSVTFPMSKMFSRLSVLPAGTTSFRVEKSSGGGAFSASTVGTTSHTTTDYEKTNSSLTGSVSSGDLVRVYFTAVAGMGGQYQVQLEGDATS